MKKKVFKRYEQQGHYPTNYCEFEHDGYLENCVIFKHTYEGVGAPKHLHFIMEDGRHVAVKMERCEYYIHYEYRDKLTDEECIELNEYLDSPCYKELVFGGKFKNMYEFLKYALTTDCRCLPFKTENRPDYRQLNK